MTQHLFDYFREPLILRFWPLLAWVAMECLVSIWAGVSRRHWFVRALAVWAAVALLAPIEAHDAVWFFTVIALLIVGLLQVRRWATAGIRNTCKEFAFRGAPAQSPSYISECRPYAPTGRASQAPIAG